MLIAWGVVFVAGLGALAGVFVLTRRIPSPWFRSLVRCLAAAWLLVPAGIQAVPGYYAPAFIVALFEGFFRQDGEPGRALVLLTSATLLVSAILLLAFALNARKAHKAFSTSDNPSDKRSSST